MAFWEIDMQKEQFWYNDNKNVMVKTDKVVVKKRDRNGAFEKSIIMPTELYPLNATHEVFTVKNTEEMEDKKVIEIFDSVKYQMGHCYTNSQALYEKLIQAGYDAKTYCGWLFVGETEFPIHHCWVVLGNSVLDLSDDMTMISYVQNINKDKINTKKDALEMLRDFNKVFLKEKNSKRCMPVGTPAPTYFYVGSECTPQMGKMIYNGLIDKFPNHDCQKNCNSTGLNMTQLYLQDALKIKM